MTTPSVLIIGGGVGGLTAAHELALRGFSVDIYETRPTFGGKARSEPVVGSAGGGRADLPGEHGFRFYPRFYQHVPDTMSRIPSPLGGSVRDRLMAVTEAAIARIGVYPEITFARQEIDKPYDILETLEIFFDDMDFDDEDMSLFATKILQFATSCDERRLGQYEDVSWYNFLDAPECSPEFQKQLRGIPRMLVAMDAMRGSARTVGTITMQLLLDFATTGVNNDRTMSGPTTEMWIDPWHAELSRLGVRLHASTSIASIEVAGGKIAGVTLAGGAKATADYYVLAVPLDVAIPTLAATPALTALDPALARLAAQNPADLVSWMVGIQFYLYEDVPLVRGHTFYPDAPWALTSISQPQFWRKRGLFRRLYGDGTVGGLISVDISEWDTPGAFVTKAANQCTPAEIASEVWQQLKAAQNGPGPGEQPLTDDLLVRSHLDDDLSYGSGLPPVNSSPLLVHPPGSWAIRPDAGTAVPNLVLASDYVRTYTNIASMEGANEAGRRAANAILQRAGSSAAPAQLWPLVEPARLDRAKQLDAALYRRGKPHVFELLGLEDAAKAGAWLRRFEAAVGISAFDGWFDTKFRATKIINALLTALGVPIA